MNEILYSHALGRTTDESLKRAKERYKEDCCTGSIIMEIYNHMSSDTEDDTIHLLDLYLEADKKERAILDSMMVCICGYTMESIIFLMEEDISKELKEEGYEIILYDSYGNRKRVIQCESLAEAEAIWKKFTGKYKPTIWKDGNRLAGY